MEIIGSKRLITLGTFALSSLVTSLEAIIAEHMEAFVQNCILPFGFTAGTGELLLKFTNFLLKLYPKLLLFATQKYKCLIILTRRTSSAVVAISNFFARSYFFLYIWTSSANLCVLNDSCCQALVLSATIDCASLIWATYLSRCSFKSAACCEVSIAFRLWKSVACWRQEISFSWFWTWVDKMRSFSSNLRVTWICASNWFYERYENMN